MSDMSIGSLTGFYPNMRLISLPCHFSEILNLKKGKKLKFLYVILVTSLWLNFNLIYSNSYVCKFLTLRFVKPEVYFDLSFYFSQIHEPGRSTHDLCHPTCLRTHCCQVPIKDFVFTRTTFVCKLMIKRVLIRNIVQFRKGIQSVF